MRAATLSIMGLYNWDKTLFDLMQLPEGLNKNDLVTNLIAELAELETIYPNPVIMKNLIGVWSRKQLSVWQHLYETTQYEYDPIENYNRYETGSDDGSGSTIHSGTDTTSGTETHTGKDTRTIDRDMGGSDSSSGSETVNHYIAGFNSSELVNNSKDESENENSVEYGGTEDVTDELQHGESITTSGSTTHGTTVTESREGSHELHAHGNIGVMSTQDMIKQEREIALFNLYDIIIDEFKQRFCVMVY